ncbi:MFS transporter, partial [Streptomyces sp. F8]|nr:MFS transporter [Streptomyces sp. F8]
PFPLAERRAHRPAVPRGSRRARCARLRGGPYLLPVPAGLGGFMSAAVTLRQGPGPGAGGVTAGLSLVPMALAFFGAFPAWPRLVALRRPCRHRRRPGPGAGIALLPAAAPRYGGPAPGPAARPGVGTAAS